MESLSGLGSLWALAFAGWFVAAWLWRRGLKMQNEHVTLQVQLAQEQTQSRLKQEALLNERALLEKAKNEFKDSFKSLAASALEGSTQQFLELAKSTLSKESELQRVDLSRRQQAIDELVRPLNQTLEKYQSHIFQIEKEREKSFSALDTEIKRIAEASTQLSRETSELKNALKKPHVRGRWGEIQLRNCIELAGMSEYADVVFQDFTSSDDGSKHIPDMTVRMPGGRLVVVDAKTPLDAFICALEAPTEELRQTEMARHGRHVKEHVKKLSLRAYSETIKASADFTVMFLPNESFLYAALESEPDLVEFALQKKVLIATPPTLIGLLKVIHFGWNEEKLTENAQKISELGKELHKRLVDFAEAFLDMGKYLDKAREEYDRSRMRLESRVLSQARRMEALGIKSPKELPEAPELES